MTKLKLKDLQLKNKKVLLRVDFNVPLKGTTILDDTRIRKALPTINYLLENEASIIIMSHLGRPKGSINEKYSLKPCAMHLNQLVNCPVKMANDTIGDSAVSLAQSLDTKEILVLENLRFDPAEESPSQNPEFAKKLAALGDLYVNDAFGASHRKHSSITSLARLFPKNAAMGFLLEKEITFLVDHFKKPQRPFFTILGGAKISTKIGVLTSLLNKVDAIFIGGGMSYTFQKLNGIDIGDSLFDESMLPIAENFLKEAQRKNISIHLPDDIVIADAFSNEAQTKEISTSENIPAGWSGMSVGKKTIASWSGALQRAKTIFWNGPLGVFEFPKFADATFDIAKLLSSLDDATTIVGGGDSVSAINSLNLSDKFTHISTGGGASLELIEHGSLPGIDALTTK